MSNSIIAKCLDILQKEEFKHSIKCISKPVCDNLMSSLLPQIHLYLIIYLIILLVILLLNLGTFIIILKNKS